TAALRDLHVPEGPPPSIKASTVEAMESANTTPDIVRLYERKRKMFRYFRYSGAAAAVAAIATPARWQFLMDRTALGFGDMVENVKNARSVTFITKIPTIVQGSRRGVLQQKFYVMGDGFRMELPSAQQDVQIPPDAPSVLLAMIADLKQKKGLELAFLRKTGHSL